MTTIDTETTDTDGLPAEYADPANVLDLYRAHRALQAAIAADPAARLRMQIAKLAPRVLMPEHLPGLAAALAALQGSPFAFHASPTVTVMVPPPPPPPAQQPDLEVEALWRSRAEKLAEALAWLDARGRLGLDVHEHIRAVLKDAGAVTPDGKLVWR